jgi:hypothetical protein
MATVAGKPETEQAADWGLDWHDAPAYSVPAALPAARSGGVAAVLSSPFVAVADWHDTRRMRTALRRGATAAAGGGGGPRELFYRFDDWRLERRGRKYARPDHRRRRVTALALIGLVALALAGAVAFGMGGAKAPAHRAAAVQIAVPNHTVGVPPAVAVSAGHKYMAALAARQRHAAALRHRRAAALHRKRVAALRARRHHHHAARAVHRAPVAAAAPKAAPVARAAPRPAPVYHAPVYRQPVYHAPAPKPAPKSQPKGQSFDTGG